MNAKKIIAIIFAVIILALPIATTLAPKSDFSETENRKLSTLPEFSIASIFDKSFMNGIDSYISDHFIGRDLWVELKSKLELATLKRENNSILLADNGKLVENLNEPNERKVYQNIDGIIKFAENNPDVKIYAAIAPTSCDIYSGELPYGKQVFSQKETISNFYSSLGKSVYGIDLYSSLSSNKDQYIYYNTDHHWTSLGAYYAYTQIAAALDFVPYDKNQFDIEHASKSFYGTYSSKSKISVDSDTIDIYKLKSSDSADIIVSEVLVNNGKETVKYDDIYFREWLTKKDKYSVFLGQVQPEITIKTNVQNNKKLLMFKDSFAHSLIPFLSLHYSEIKLIDLRYTNKNYRDLADVKSYDNVLLLYNIESAINDTSISALGE